MAAALIVSPKVGSYEVGSTFSVNVSVNANDVAFNAASGRLLFPPDTLEVVAVSKTASVVSLWVQEPAFSNSAGNVSFEGILLNSDDKVSNGNLISVQFRVKKAGMANISFTSGEILANDGIGTNILSSLGTGSYILLSKPAALIVEDSPIVPKEASTTGTSASVTEAIIVSDSHPLNEWSNQSSGTFMFEFDEDVTAMRLLVDDMPNSVPVVVYQPPIKEKTLSDLFEGISYLHVQLKDKNGWGAVKHYKLQIDTKAPEQMLVKEVAPQNGTLKTFLLTAIDSVSGIEGYEISIDGGQSTVVSATGVETFFAPRGLVTGIHTLEVKVFDTAGNFIFSSLQFEIKGESEQTKDKGLWSRIIQNTNGFLIVLILFPLILLIGFLLFIYLLTRARQQEQQVALATQAVKHDALRATMLLRTELESGIALLEKAKQKRALTKEESKILKGAQKSFADSESYIDDYFHIPSEADIPTQK